MEHQADRADQMPMKDRPGQGFGLVEIAKGMKAESFAEQLELAIGAFGAKPNRCVDDRHGLVRPPPQ